MITWRDFDGWFTEADAKVYKFIVDRIPKEGVIVEVGAWQGRSTGALIELVRATRKRPHIHVVDTFTGSPNEPQHLEAVAQYGGSVLGLWIRNMQSIGYYKRLHHLTTTSGNAAPLFKKRSVDAVFIDANHSYNSVMNDIAAWRPKMKAGSIMAGHDYDYTDVMTAVHDSFTEPVAAIGRCWLVVIAAKKKKIENEIQIENKR